MEARVEEMNRLEDFGVLTEELTDTTPTYNLKALLDYCKRIGRLAEELSEEERERFRTN